MNTSMKYEQIAASIPHLVGYQPSEAIAVMPFADQPNSQYRNVATGVVQLENLRANSAEAVASKIHQRVMVPRNADRVFVVLYSSDESAISDVVKLADEFDHFPGVTTLSVLQVDEGQVRSISPDPDAILPPVISHWAPLPSVAHHIAEQKPTPAVSRDHALQHYSPHPEATYEWISQPALSYFETLPPSESATYVTDRLTADMSQEDVTKPEVSS